MTAFRGVGDASNNPFRVRHLPSNWLPPFKEPLDYLGTDANGVGQHEGRWSLTMQVIIL